MNVKATCSGALFSWPFLRNAAIYLWDLELLTSYVQFAADGFGTSPLGQTLAELTETVHPMETTMSKGCKSIQTWLKKSMARWQREAFQCGMENEQTSGRKLTLVEVEGREHRDALNFSPWDGRTQPQQDRTGNGNRTDTRHHRNENKDQSQGPGRIAWTCGGHSVLGPRNKGDSFITAHPVRVGLIAKGEPC